MSSGRQPPPVSVPDPQPERQFSASEFSLVADSLGPGCSLNKRQELLNHVTAMSGPPPSTPYRFPGTRGSLELSSKDIVYWEVRLKIAKRDPYKPDAERLLQLGVATEQVLRAAAGNGPSDGVNKAGVTVTVDVDQKESEVDFRAMRGRVELDPEGLAAKTHSSKPNGSTLGFLFDGPKSTLYVCKPTSSEIWWTSEVDVSQPLYPYICVTRRENVGREINVELITGQKIGMTRARKKFVDDIVKGDGGRYKVVPYMS